MARRKSQAWRPWWRSHELTIPPDSLRAWVRLGAWESRMGMFVYVAVAFGTQLIVTAPASVVPVFDFTNCYAAPPIAQPCERVAYRVGTLNAAVNVWCGLLLLAIAAWLVWELWNAVPPKPITDDFLKLLDDSFARDWRKPTTWSWMRAVWAYGFTLVGATAAACIGLMISAAIASYSPAKTPTAHVETSQRFRVTQSR